MGKTFALLFSGGADAGNNQSRYAADLQLIGSVLIGAAGVTIDTVDVLHADGRQTFTFNGKVLQSLLASKANLQKYFALAANTIRSDDNFVFVASNHGGPGNPPGNGVVLYCWNDEVVSDSEFGSWCSSLLSRQQIYIFGQCNSGGFLTIASDERLVMAACTATQKSWATADTRYDEFLLRIAEGLEMGLATYQSVFDYARQHDTREEQPEISGSALKDNPNLLSGQTLSNEILRERLWIEG